MGRQTELKDKTRNNIFAAAIDEIRRREGKVTQLELARRMGVNKDTITNILRYRTAVTDDIITRLQTASGCIFNLQWLRGESDIMLSEQISDGSETIGDGSETFGNSQLPGMPTYSSMSNSIIAAKDDAIEALKREAAAKDETIKSLKREGATKDALIESLQQQVADLRSAFAEQQKKGSYGNYPFTHGVADNGERISTEK